MVRLADLPDYEREHLLSKNMPPLGPPVWTTPTRPVSRMRFAIVTTAGLHYRDDPAFDAVRDEMARDPWTAYWLTQMLVRDLKVAWDTTQVDDDRMFMSVLGERNPDVERARVRHPGPP